MRKDDQQLGTPQILYKDTKAAIEALSGLMEGAIAYATDTDEAGTYSGSAWIWNGASVPMSVLEENYYPHRWLPDLVWNYATVAIVSTTKLRITISATTNLGYYWRGSKVDLRATSLQVTSTADKAEGIWYCYTRDGVNFELNQTPFHIWDIVSGARRADLMIWEFYWDNTNDVALWVQPEFHAMLNPSEHGYMHESYGTRYSNGLDITYGTTAANADTRLKLTSGELHDEDISAYVVHAASPAAIWEQLLGSAGTADANYAALPIYYLFGATPVWRKTATDSYPFKPASVNLIYYNRLNAGSYDYATSITGNNYVVCWIVGTTNQAEPVVAIPGRQDNATLTAAQSEAFPSLSTLFTEYKLLYRIIYRGSASNTNNGKCAIVSVTDYRRDNIANNAAATSTTTAALVAFTPAGGVSATNVQAAIEELDSEKASTALASTSAAGLAPQATAPASGVRNVLAIDNGETGYKDTALVGSTTPAALGTASAGTSLVAARDDHVHAKTGVTPDDGWIPVTSTWTRTGNHTFTVAGDVTSIYRKGVKVRYKDGGNYEYGTIYSSSYSSQTTITLVTNSDYEMAAATITDTYISLAENPEGFPHWFNYVATLGGITIGNGTIVTKWAITGKVAHVRVKFIAGSTTAITGATAFSTPILPVATYPSCSALIDDSGTATYLGAAYAVGLTIYVMANNAAGNYVNLAYTSSTVPMTWTTSDGIYFELSYEW